MVIIGEIFLFFPQHTQEMLKKLQVFFFITVRKYIVKGEGPQKKDN